MMVLCSLSLALLGFTPFSLCCGWSVSKGHHSIDRCFSCHRRIEFLYVLVSFFLLEPRQPSCVVHFFVRCHSHSLSLSCCCPHFPFEHQDISSHTLQIVFMATFFPPNNKLVELFPWQNRSERQTNALKLSTDYYILSCCVFVKYAK